MSRDANVLAQAISRRRLFVYLGTGVGLSLMAACQSAPSTPAAPAAPAAKAPAPPAPAPAAPAPAPAAPAAAPAPAASPAVKAPAATGGGSLTVAFSTEPDTFDAPDVVGSIGGWFLVNFFDGLTQTGPDMSVRPGLAESWSPSSDGLTWTFRLRRGVQFHDGQPFDAEAAKFSLDRHLDPNKPLRRSALYSTVIKSARVVDSGTLELALHRPFAGLPSLLATPYAGLASPKAVQELGQEYPRKPVGTGPFMLKEWVSGQKIVLQRNERYWGGSPALQEVVFQLVPDASTRAALLETGQADIAEHLPPSEMKRLTANPQVVALEADALETREVKFNMLHDQFKDVRVRQAMNHAINVPEIVDAVLSGAGTYTGGPMPKAVPGALVTDKYRYDPAAAKRLLTEAGVPNGFKTELIGTSARGSGIQEMLEAVQAQWRAVGVDATLNIMDTAAFSRLSGTGPEEGKDKQLMSVGLTTIYPDPHASLLLFHSSQWAPKGNNRGFYKNQRVDDLLDQGAAEADATKRAALYREAQELIVNDAPGVFLYTSKLVFGARRNVSGLALLPTATINFAGVSKA